MTLAKFEKATSAELAASGDTAVLDSLWAYIAVLGRDGTILTTNERWRQRPGNVGVGDNYLTYCAALAGDCSASGIEVAAGIRSVLEGERDLFWVQYGCHDGTERRWFHFVVSPLARGTRTQGAVVAHYDVTAQVKLAEERTRQLVALQSAGEAIFIVDAGGRIDWGNEAFLSARGCQSADALTLSEAGGPELAGIVATCRQNRAVWSGEVGLIGRDGRLCTVEETVTPIPDASGAIGHVVVVQHDITLRKETQLRMAHLAEHDSVTGLLNRKSFHHRLGLAIEEHRSAGHELAVLFIDLHRFKHTNDAFGDRVGDAILAETARRLRSRLGESGLAARLAGDEFAILLNCCGDREQVRQQAERILAAFQRPIEVEGQRVTAGAGIGVALFPSDGHTYESLLRCAGLALHRAKAEGRRGFRFYDAALEAETGERASIEQEMNQSLRARDWWIAYQPQWNIQTRRIVGAEGLLRWKPAARRGISMSRIVSIAEDSGLILPVGQWVVKKSLAQLRTWRHTVRRPLHLAINLSAVQLNQEDVAGLFAQEIRRCGIAPSSLKAEITESALVQNSNRVAGTLRALHETGVGLVLDDFGTGYSSLAHLRQFPIESVKIDSSFVGAIGRQRQDEAIVKGIVHLAHSLGITVVAEGVETEDQLAFLQSVQCDSAQGYLVSPALPPADFEALVEADRAGIHSPNTALMPVS